MTRPLGKFKLIQPMNKDIFLLQAVNVGGNPFIWAAIVD